MIADRLAQRPAASETPAAPTRRAALTAAACGLATLAAPIALAGPAPAAGGLPAPEGVSSGLADLLARWPAAIAELRDAEGEADRAAERHEDMFGEAPILLDGVRMPDGGGVTGDKEHWEISGIIDLWKQEKLDAVAQMRRVAPDAAEAAMRAIEERVAVALRSLEPVKLEDERRRIASGAEAAAEREAAAWSALDVLVKSVVNFVPKTGADAPAMARFVVAAGRFDERFQWARWVIVDRLAGECAPERATPAQA